jgi:predicted dehydrogenase
MNRRSFLKMTALGAGGLALSSRTAYADEFAGLNKRVGLIGSGWYGKCDLWRLVQLAPVRIVSICDVDKQLLAEAADIAAARQASKTRPRTYSDYREMLKEKDLDIVLVATPDHWHALPMIEAVRAGADVYVQKPTSVDVVESQAMLKAARKHGRVVQVGTQRRSTPHLIEARDRVLREGKLGTVSHVEICCYYHMRARGNPPDENPPDYLDYDMWTGPAPMRPFCKWKHPRGWRAFMEYSNGIMGDMGIHMLDMVRWMMDLGWPRSISSAGGILVDKTSKANTPDTQSAIFDFPSVQVVWNHRTWGDGVDPDYPWAATFYGDKGTLKASIFKYDYYPQGKKEPAASGTPLYEYDKYPEDKTEKGLEQHCASAIRWHMKDFLRNIASRGRPVADIEQGCISSICCILANLSLKLGRSLAYDPAKGIVPGDEEATRLLRRPYRAPWIHPDPDKV